MFASDFSSVFYYSPLGNILGELGQLTVYGTTVSVSGPGLITGPGSYTYTATVYGEASGSDYQWQESYDGTSWTNVGTDSYQYTDVGISCGSGLSINYYVRVTATGGTGYGQQATSDPFVTLIRC